MEAGEGNTTMNPLVDHLGFSIFFIIQQRKIAMIPLYWKTRPNSQYDNKLLNWKKLFSKTLT